ncbi:hypothetical protein ACP3TY_06140 [Pseudomonas rustica]|uniref:hypothetical protein n=1 Tax=Pseudomonas TaxID=286 RepID=UPI00087BE532|nr:hypothetical protein [Pseudomonas sp. Z003-0.4C(8344-21)]SDS63541.1 hypothetical protein SAMN05216496_2042 [Pseudomonas sp. Z003-0.4C(8344-21)]
MNGADLLLELDTLLKQWWYVGLQDERHLSSLETLKATTDDGVIKNKIWVYSTLLKCHLLHEEIFNLLKSESFYPAWCKLENLEILLANVRGNHEHVERDYGQAFLTNAVNSWQMLYPYKVFSSSREIIKKMSCSICESPRSVLQSCKHRRGKLYAGEFCQDVVEDFELITYDLVANPVVKAAVPFRHDGDHYDYSLLRAGLQVVTTARHWFSVSKLGVPVAKHTGVHSPSFPCPCRRSLRKYEDCCLPLSMIEHDHFIIDVLTPRRASVG